MIVIKGWMLIMGNTPGLCRPIQAFMQSSGIGVHYVDTLEKALDSVKQHEYCLVILELLKLNESSIEAIYKMQSIKPILFLAITDAIKPELKIRLFQVGVHAHIEKPVRAEVCIAQANALMQLCDTNAGETSRDELSFGNELIIKPQFRRVFVHGQPLELTRKEFDLLYYLAQFPYQVFSYEQLYSHVWRDEYTYGGEKTVKVHIVTLRKKLGAIQKNCIQNEWGIGYKFLPPDRMHREL